MEEKDPIEFFDKMTKNAPKHVIPYLINKLKDEDSALGDFARDCIDDIGIGPYMKDGLLPDMFFQYMYDVCSEECKIFALEPFRKMYNNSVNKEYKIYKHRIKYSYGYSYYYSWFIDWEKQNRYGSDHNVYWFTKVFDTNGLTVSDIKKILNSK